MTSVEATVLREGLDFGEAPRWRDGRLWFSDFYRHAVFTLDEDGAEERVLDVPEQPSGLGWLPDGRLLVVSMRDRRVLRREADGSLVQHADLSRFATFHANDLLVDERGRAYVGNFGSTCTARWPPAPSRRSSATSRRAPRRSSASTRTARCTRSRRASASRTGWCSSTAAARWCSPRPCGCS